jgi:hypothetical protein
MSDREWKPTRWYRILNPDDGSLWMETSDPKEAAKESAATGWPVKRLWQEVPRIEWREVDL